MIQNHPLDFPKTQSFKHRPLSGADLYLGQAMEDNPQPVGQRSRLQHDCAAGMTGVELHPY